VGFLDLVFSIAIHAIAGAAAIFPVSENSVQPQIVKYSQNRAVRS
jgi:hypothetical protein